MSSVFRAHRWTLFVLLVVLGLLSFLAYERLAPGGFFAGLKNDLQHAAPTPEASYIDLDRNPIDLLDFKGKPLVITVWTSWMPFSKNDLTLLSTLHTEYGDAVVFLALNRMEDVEVNKAYLTMYGIDQTALQFVVDPTDYFYKTFDGYAMPETLVYRDDGTLVTHFRGPLEESEMRKSIANALE